jgi:hypothetical protein
MKHLIAFLLLLLTLPAQQPGWTYQTVVPGLTAQATSFAPLPDGRALICERQTGLVRVAIGGVVQATPWYSVGYSAPLPVQEYGLLGIAVAPTFASDGRVFICYTNQAQTACLIDELAEVSGAGVWQLTRVSRAFNGTHNSGPLAFGGDGYLYAQTGDTNAFPVPSPVWADPRGKILRIGPAPGDGWAAFSAGHRNGYGLCVDPEYGWIFATENGQAGPDEINRIVSGGNYGWPTYEGTVSVAGYTDPILDLPGFVPTGCALASRESVRRTAGNGDLFITGWSGPVRRLVLNANGTAVVSNSLWWTPTSGLQVYALANGPDGNLWVLQGAGWAGYEIGRYVDTTATWPGIHIAPVSGPSIGGSVTVGLTALTGELMLSWVSMGTYSPPVGSPWGPIYVPADQMLPAAVMDARGNAYHLIAIPADASLLGQTIHAQGMTYDPSTGAGTATIMASHALR